MTSLRLLVPWFVLVALPAAANDAGDLLRFRNGDLIHGRYAGIDEGPRLRWQRDDLEAPIAFDTSKLRQLVFNGARPRVPQQHASFVTLVNGDCLPGRIAALDDTRVFLETNYAGVLEIPRDAVALIAPNPHGGNLHYSGPFSLDGWRMPAKTKPAEAEEATEEAKNSEAADPAWILSGASFYGNSSLPLTRDVDMPDRASFRFELAWRNRLNLAIAFHADFHRPEAKDQEEHDELLRRHRGHQSFPHAFGNAYVLTLYSNYAQLWRSEFDLEGNQANPQQLQSGNTNLDFPEMGRASFELRCDRISKTIALFIDGKFALQWEDPGPYAGRGGGIGFAAVNDNSTQVRISEIVVSSWNGLMDSARSMEADAQDVILLVNGMDRFAGTLREIGDETVTLSGTYAEMKIPLNEVAEIRLARDHRREAAPGADAAAVRFHPVGRISGRFLHSSTEILHLESGFLGEVEVDVRHAVMFDFDASPSFLDDWNQSF